MNAPGALDFDAAGNLYLADWHGDPGVGAYSLVHRLDPNGVLTWVAGNVGSVQSIGPMTAIDAVLGDVIDLATDPRGGLGCSAAASSAPVPFGAWTRLAG